MRPARGSARACACACACAAAAWLSGCGPLPPQAPLAAAQKLDRSTSGISTACGLAYQVAAFGGPHAPEIARLDALVSHGSVPKLARVAAAHPNWIYQGQTVAEITHDSVAYLRACGLTRSAGVLARASR